MLLSGVRCSSLCRVQFSNCRICALVLFFNFSWKVRFQNQAKVGYSSQNCTSPSRLFDCTFLAEVLSLYFHLLQPYRINTPTMRWDGALGNWSSRVMKGDKVASRSHYHNFRHTSIYQHNRSHACVHHEPPFNWDLPNKTYAHYRRCTCIIRFTYQGLLDTEESCENRNSFVLVKALFQVCGTWNPVPLLFLLPMH